MNQLSIILTQTLRQLLTGFLFTSGGILALALFQKVFHLGICP